MSTETPTKIKTPEATDYFDVRSQLTEDERMIQDVVARFVGDRVMPVITEAFDNHCA